LTSLFKQEIIVIEIKERYSLQLFFESTTINPPLSSILQIMFSAINQQLNLIYLEHCCIYLHTDREGHKVYLTDELDFIETITCLGKLTPR